MHLYDEPKGTIGGFLTKPEMGKYLERLKETFFIAHKLK